MSAHLSTYQWEGTATPTGSPGRRLSRKTTLTRDDAPAETSAPAEPSAPAEASAPAETPAPEEGPTETAVPAEGVAGGLRHDGGSRLNVVSASAFVHFCFCAACVSAFVYSWKMAMTLCEKI